MVMWKFVLLGRQNGGNMRLRRLVRTFSGLPFPAYGCAVVVCGQMGYPLELVERVRKLIVWEREKMYL